VKSLKYHGHRGFITHLRASEQITH
jgi:hypothetical protein